jgi:hypothetical protein
VQGDFEQLTIPGMAQGPGRRIGTPSQYRAAIQQRTREGRESLGWSHARMAQELSHRVGRHIAADSYRKWETDAMMPHDVILPFCDIIKMHPYEFLGRVRPRSSHSAA